MAPPIVDKAGLLKGAFVKLVLNLEQEGSDLAMAVDYTSVDFATVGDTFKKVTQHMKVSLHILLLHPSGRTSAAGRPQFDLLCSACARASLLPH